MSWFRRCIGPRPPSRFGAIWRAMIAAAPLKEWTRLGAGIALTVYNFALLAAVRFGWPASIAKDQMHVLFWVAIFGDLLLLVAIVSTFDINLKVNANRQGFSGDFSHEDDERQTVDVAGQVTLTPQAPKGDE